MSNKQESIEWDNENGGLIITKKERISIDGVTDAKDALKKIDTRLAEIIQTVKGLKAEAEALKNIKSKLMAIETIEPAPEGQVVPAIEEAQSPSAETPQSI